MDSRCVGTVIFVCLSAIYKGKQLKLLTSKLVKI